MENITFDPKKLLRVPISQVYPNNWNPKKDDTEEEAKVLLSVEKNGQRLPIVVRQKKKGKGKLYQIVDGEQRFKACRKLKFAEVLIYNEGVMDDDSAKALTIWYQQQVPFDKVLEAALVVSMSNVILPYSEREIEVFKQIMDFDWTKVKPDPIEDVEFRTLTLRFEKNAYKVVMRAVEKVQKEKPVSVETALELICADFNSS